MFLLVHWQYFNLKLCLCVCILCARNTHKLYQLIEKIIKINLVWRSHDSLNQTEISGWTVKSSTKVYTDKHLQTHTHIQYTHTCTQHLECVNSPNFCYYRLTDKWKIELLKVIFSPSMQLWWCSLTVFQRRWPTSGLSQISTLHTYQLHEFGANRSEFLVTRLSVYSVEVLFRTWKVHFSWLFDSF